MYGEVLIDGKQCRRNSLSINVQHTSARVFQDPMAGTAPSMTIEENLAIAYSRNKKRKLKLGVTKKRKEMFREHL